MQYHDILRDYLRDYAISAMLEMGWVFKAAKSYGWGKAQRGPEFHIDQPLRTHILNGLYPLTRLLEFLKDNAYYFISEREFKRVLVLYTFHDAYKDEAFGHLRSGGGEFDVPLEPFEELIERLHLREFADVQAVDLRAASVSLRSQKVSDFSSCTPGTTHLLTFVHLADSFASQQTASDYGTTERRIREISRGDALAALREQKASKRLGTTPSEQPLRPALTCYYHELDDYRGLSSLLIHQAAEKVLIEVGLYPILYFANGNLYLGAENQTFPDLQELRSRIARTLFALIREEAQKESLGVARDACDTRKGMHIDTYAYLFCSFHHLLDAVEEKTPLGKPKDFVVKILTNRVQKKKYKQIEEFYTLYLIPLRADTHELLARHWLAASKQVMAAESIAKTLVSGNTLEWLFQTFNTPEPVAKEVRKNIAILSSGGVSDHSLIIAYHWLTNTHFTDGQRTWSEVETSFIQKAIKGLILNALQPYGKIDDLLSVVEKELGFQHDLMDYLRSNLTFSFDRQRFHDEDLVLKEYEKERKRAHKRLCVICNRFIPLAVSKKSSEINTSIADQQAQVFSNRRTPSEEVKEMMVWCPMCSFEFLLRKLSGQAYPSGSDYNSSYRLYLYVLPDYSFTPQLWEETARDLLKDHFHPQETTVSRLNLRGSKDEPGLPRLWLEKRTVNQSWLDDVRTMFAQQADFLKTPTKKGRKRSVLGDRIAFSIRNPNYMLISYSNAVARQADASLLPTHIEVWTKALYAAALIHLLTGARVYVTDKPYLSITRPEQMKTIIEMEGLHPLLYSLLPIRRDDEQFASSDLRTSEGSSRLPLAALPVILDLLAAIWEINAGLYPDKPGEIRNLDKQVASILEKLRVNYLAGATLYKMRERNQDVAYPLFTRACQILLPQYTNQRDDIRHALYNEGYELMLDQQGGDLLNLTQTLTETSLKLYRPSTKKGKGRAHRFETLFRTGVEAIKSNAGAMDNDDELVARVAGTILKRLERILENEKYSPSYGSQQVAIVEEFANILVRELFSKRCGRSVSRLTHEENSLADAIYFLTLQKVDEYWRNYRTQKTQQEEQAAGITSDVAVNTTTEG